MLHGNGTEGTFPLLSHRSPGRVPQHWSPSPRPLLTHCPPGWQEQGRLRGGQQLGAEPPRPGFAFQLRCVTLGQPYHLSKCQLVENKTDSPLDFIHENPCESSCHNLWHTVTTHKPAVVTDIFFCHCSSLPGTSRPDNIPTEL